MLLSQRLKTAVLELFLGKWDYVGDVNEWVILVDNDGPFAITFTDDNGPRISMFPDSNYNEYWTERVLNEDQFLQIPKRRLKITTGAMRIPSSFSSGAPRGYHVRFYSTPNADGTGTRTLLASRETFPDFTQFNDTVLLPDDHASIVFDFRFFDSSGGNLGSQAVHVVTPAFEYVE